MPSGYVDLHSGGQALIDVKKTVVAANPVRQQISLVLRGVSDVDSQCHPVFYLRRQEDVRIFLLRFRVGSLVE